MERDAVKEASPRALHTLAAVYEVDYIDLMRRAAYIPADAPVTGATIANIAFRGASQLSESSVDASSA